jgi:hypothetical protein
MWTIWHDGNRSCVPFLRQNIHLSLTGLRSSSKICTNSPRSTLVVHAQFLVSWPKAFMSNKCVSHKIKLDKLSEKIHYIFLVLKNKTLYLFWLDMSAYYLRILISVCDKNNKPVFKGLIHVCFFSLSKYFYKTKLISIWYVRFQIQPYLYVTKIQVQEFRSELGTMVVSC